MATAAVVLPSGQRAVWKFGYGSNMSQSYLRAKKALEPLDSRRTVLRGWALCFPEGRGIDFVEPSFATLVQDAAGAVHGVSTLLSLEDAEKLDRDEAVGSAYDLAVCRADVYAADSRDPAAGAPQESLAVEVYVSRRPVAPGARSGCCSLRYRGVLVRGAQENGLDAAWIAKLQALPTYTPSPETLALRNTLPPPSALPQMTIAELSLHDGRDESTHPIMVSSCGYVFQHTPIFAVMRGRDVTFRNVLMARGVNLDANDDGGKSPFPVLSKLAPNELEYALQYRDRFLNKGGQPVAVLKEFWEEQI